MEKPLDFMQLAGLGTKLVIDVINKPTFRRLTLWRLRDLLIFN